MSRGALQYSWPGRYVPGNGSALVQSLDAPPLRTAAASPPCPPPTNSLVLTACNESAPEQRFAYNASSGAVVSPSADGSCVTFAGLSEGNVFLAPCDGWVVPNLGGQLWVADMSGPGPYALQVQQNLPYGLSVDKTGSAPACGAEPAGTVQVRCREWHAARCC